MMHRVILLFLACCLAGSAFAQQGRDEAERLEKMRDQANARKQELQHKAGQTQTEISGIQTQLIDLGRRISRHNQRSVETEEHLLILQEDEQIKLTALLADQASLRDILAALQRAEMSPPPPLAVSPDDTLAAARASLLLGATVPELRSRAQALQVSLFDLNQLRSEIENGRVELESRTRILAEEQDRLQGLLGQRQQLETRLRGDASLASSEAQSLGTRAANLRELIRQLELEARKTTPSIKPKPQPGTLVLAPSLKPDTTKPDERPPVWHSPTGRFADSRGQLEMPVTGVVISKFGQAPNPDQVSGIVVRTSRRAQITAPYDGRVAFVGSFQNYGQLLILDVGEGYHMVLSGLSQAYVVKGQSVLAGEPIGKMANRRKPAPEFYLEFRKKGQPFDPAPWLKRAINAG